MNIPFYNICFPLFKQIILPSSFHRFSVFSKTSLLWQYILFACLASGDETRNLCRASQLNKMASSYGIWKNKEKTSRSKDDNRAPAMADWPCYMTSLVFTPVNSSVVRLDCALYILDCILFSPINNA